MKKQFLDENPDFGRKWLDNRLSEGFQLIRHNGRMVLVFGEVNLEPETKGSKAHRLRETGLSWKQVAKEIYGTEDHRKAQMAAKRYKSAIKRINQGS